MINTPYPSQLPPGTSLATYNFWLCSRTKRAGRRKHKSKGQTVREFRQTWQNWGAGTSVYYYSHRFPVCRHRHNCQRSGKHRFCWAPLSNQEESGTGCLCRGICGPESAGGAAPCCPTTNYPNGTSANRVHHTRVGISAPELPSCACTLQQHSRTFPSLCTDAKPAAPAPTASE
jgi:hypothetical protein